MGCPVWASLAAGFSRETEPVGCLHGCIYTEREREECSKKLACAHMGMGKCKIRRAGRRQAADPGRGDAAGGRGVTAVCCGRSLLFLGELQTFRPPRIACGPPTLWGAICFAQSTDVGVNRICKKDPHGSIYPGVGHSGLAKPTHEINHHGKYAELLREEVAPIRNHSA